MREPRLGDDIDDYCVRCKRIMNHAVVSVINATPAKVRCRTCHSDHDFRHEQAPPPKVDTRKAALFNEVLKKVNPEAAAVEIPDTPIEIPEAIVEMPEAAAVEIPEAAADLLEAEAPLDAAEADGPPPALAAAPKPKAKAKAKAKGKARK
ncbi:MAG: hypothetical protein ACLQU1_04390 [Bryobacteraceae bacterium]